MARASVMPRQSEWVRMMAAQVMIARYAPAPSSPAQLRAAARLRGPDGPTRPSQEGCRSFNAALPTSPEKRRDCTVSGGC
jgi:hypothetical protein